VVNQQIAVQALEREADQRQRAEQNEQGAKEAQAEEAKQRRVAEQQAYLADMNVAFHALRENQLGRVRGLLERHRPQPGAQDLRSWEWGHLWLESRSDELFSLQSHSGGVNSIAFSPDGRLLASGGRQAVKIWDVASRKGNEVTTLKHPQVSDLAFSPDGRYLLTGTDDPTEGGPKVRFWEVRNWTEATPLTNSSGLRSLTVSPDGKSLAITEGTGDVLLYDFATQERLATLATTPSRHRAIRAVFALREPILALEEAEGIALWNIERRQKVQTIADPDRRLRAKVGRMHMNSPIALSPDGSRLVVGGTSLDVFDLERSGQRLVVTNLASELWHLAFSPDGAKLAAADADNRIIIWDTAEWTRLAELRGHRSPALDVAFSPDGKLLASAGLDGTIRLWSTTEFPEKRAWHLFSTNAMVYWQASRGLRCSPNGNSFSLRLDDRILEVRLPMKPLGEVLWMSPRGRFVCYAGQDGCYRIWEVDATKEVSTLPQEGSYVLPASCFSPDETLILGDEKATRARVVWSTDDGREVARLVSGDFGDPPGHWWGADSRTVMIADARGRGVHLWDVRKNLVRQLLRHQGAIWNVLMSRDTAHMATLGGDGIVKLWAWDGQDYRESHTIGERRPLAYQHWMCPMDFTPDNRRLVLAAGVRQLMIYDVASGREVGSPLFEGPFSGCGFSQDGKSLIVANISAFTRLRATPLSEAGR